MAWSTPPTYTVGQVLTAANLNTNVRDNLNYLYSPPMSHAYNSANISIPNATDTALTFDSTRYDTDSMHSTITNTSRLTINHVGKYLLIGTADFAANATGTRVLWIRVSNASRVAEVQLPVVGVAARTSLSVSTIYSLTAADYVELIAYQTSGGALNVENQGNFSPELSAHWIGA